MKYLKPIFATLLIAGLSGNAFAADPFADCMRKINDPVNNAALFDGMNLIFPNGTELTEAEVTKNAPKIYSLIAANVLLHCIDDLVAMSEMERGKIALLRNNKKISIDFSIATMFEHIDLRTAIFVYNDRSKTVGEVVKSSSIKKEYWTKECSKHWISGNPSSGSSAVGDAGKKTFSSYGSNNKYFLDFVDGNDKRAFPGLVIMDKSWSTKEEIVAFSNFQSGKEQAKQFADNLKNTKCSNQGLAVYQVGIDVFPNREGKDGWAIAAGVSGGAMVLFQTGMTLAVKGVITKTALAAALKVAGTSSTIPVYGWIVAAVAATTAGVIAMVPQPIQDVQQVMILGGPYNI